MEIVESLESKRKIPTAVAFYNGERFFGNDALRIGFKSPQDSFSYFIDLLGKPISHSSVKSFLKAFPYYELVPNTLGPFAFKYVKLVQYFRKFSANNIFLLFDFQNKFRRNFFTRGNPCHDFQSLSKTCSRSVRRNFNYRFGIVCTNLF